LEHSALDTKDTLTVLAQVDWSSDSSDGILLHALHVEEGDVFTTFDPPILIAEPQAKPEDVQTTVTGGYTFTATFDAIEGCGTLWAPDWEDEDCIVVTLADGDEDPVTNGYIVGTYWLVPSWGAALMELDGYPAQWTLAQAVWNK
ncbi:MAG: hypothetical protein JXB39_16690, partial [Deltaproteobacteria bacterium]|nr:hypothetical protein [Deltaproteobacteria bacterium]